MIRVLNIISDTNIGGAGRVILNYLSYADRSQYETMVAIPRGSMLKEPLEQAGAQVLHGTGDLDGDQGGQIQCWFQPDSYGLLRAELSQDGVTVVTMKFSDFSFTFPEGGAEYSTECP